MALPLRYWVPRGASCTVPRPRAFGRVRAIHRVDGVAMPDKTMRARRTKFTSRKSAFNRSWFIKADGITIAMGSLSREIPLGAHTQQFYVIDAQNYCWVRNRGLWAERARRCAVGLLLAERRERKNEHRGIAAGGAFAEALRRPARRRAPRGSSP